MLRFEFVCKLKPKKQLEKLSKKNDLDNYLEKETNDLVKIINQENINYLNLANKNYENNNLELAKKLANLLPEKSICIHFSLKYQYKKNASITKEWFLQAIQHLIDFQIDSVLLVSGVPKRSVDTLVALKLCEQADFFNKIEICVCYNPFLPEEEQKIEDDRLIEKLRFAGVKAVFLQIGLDKQKALKGIKFIRKNRPNIKIVGSVFVPSPSFSKSFQFRPWKGVFISDEFFKLSQEKQILVCLDMKRFYESLQAEILIEQFPFLQKEWDKFKSLLKN